MTFTMLKLECPSCKENFIIQRKEYKRNIKNAKKPKNLNKIFLQTVKRALENPKQTGIITQKLSMKLKNNP